MTKTTAKTTAFKTFKSKSVKSAEKPASTKLDATVTPAPCFTRTQQLLDILGRESGASSTEMIAVTGWLPHSLRAALSGLRKKGHNISRIKDESGNNRYQLTVSTAKPVSESSEKISTAAPQPRKTDRRSAEPARLKL